MKFVAQSLDNDAPMIVASGRVLYDEGDPRRRAVLDETAAASGRGAETVVTDRVKLYEHNEVFAFKVYPKTTDAAGRKAPILASVRNDQVGGDGWPEVALEDLAWFAEAAGRPLDAELREDALAGFAAAKKKVERYRQTRSKLVVTVLVMVLVILAAVLGWWIGQ